MTILDIVALILGSSAILLVLNAIGKYSDRKQWNGGICPYNGKPWELFCDEFTDRVGYESGPYTVWLSRKTKLVNRRTYVLEED